MNIDLLMQVCDRIAKHPEGFDMDYWGHKTECGTTFCIAGWALVLSGQQPARYLVNYLGGMTVQNFGASGEQPGVEASALLRLTECEGNKLFLLDNWPQAFRQALDMADSHEQAAEVVIRRIHHFIRERE